MSERHMTTEWTGVKKVVAVSPEAVKLLENPATCDLAVLESIYLKIFENSADAMIVINRRGMIELFNTSAELLFDYAREDVTGRPVETLLPADRHERHRFYRDEYFQEPRVREMGLVGQRLEGVRRDGSVFQLQIKLSPLVVPGSGTYALAVVRRVKPVVATTIDTFVEKRGDWSPEKELLDAVDKKGDGM